MAVVHPLGYTTEDIPKVEDLVKLNPGTLKKLIQLGILKTEANSVRDTNVGASNYSEHIIQPWSIWIDWKLNPWDADIIKRVLRNKSTDSRKMDYQKIIHICQERIRQLDNGND